MIRRYSCTVNVPSEVPAEKIDGYRERLTAKGIKTTIINHDNSPSGRSAEVNENTVIRSIYFMDPDGIVLEFAGRLRPREELFKEPEPAKLSPAPSHAEAPAK